MYDLPPRQNDPYAIPALGNVVFKKSPIQEFRKTILDPNKQIEEMFIKQRIVERLPDAIDKLLPDNLESKFDAKQLELLSLVLNYYDFYNPCSDIIKDDKTNKFIYTLHALNHVLK